MTNLQYDYAVVEPDTGYCYSCGTYSYNVPLSNYIPVPNASDEYIGKYYSFETELWYYDSEFTEIFDTSSL